MTRACIVARSPSVREGRDVRFRWAVSAILVIGAIVIAATGIPRASGDTAVTSTRSAATPLWSPRRLPGPFVDPVNAEHERAAALTFQRALDAQVAPFGTACFVVKRGTSVLAARNADTPMLPASTQKLLTAAAALTTLGPDFRFETNAVASGDGPAIDRLWFVGAGDPVIRTAAYMDEGVSTSLESLADAIVARGIRRIGTVVGDESRYDTQRFVPSWSPTYRIDFDIEPMGALEVTESVALVNGKPVVFDDPAVYAASELTRLLRSRGVTVGEPTSGIAPESATRVASVTSQPLKVIVRWMLATSNNLAAEMLTKELGFRARHEGTTAAGVVAVQQAIRGLGVSLEGQTMVDGSGLDRQNRLTCSILLDVVDLGDRPGLRVLRDTLPGGGSPTPDGKIHAKGGYLTDVTGLAGIVDRDAPLRFAFLANGGVPKNANVDLAAFSTAVTSYQPPAPVPDAVIPAP
jgi:D-alanyl-D-alanine carboxypeptidase/D-alanyl-D-alanine-endopeptidase (penicillin-binding protein 4)